MKLYKVEEHPDLMKDMDSKAVLNTNYAALLEYRKKKQMEEEFNNLKSDVNDIKVLLNSIVSMLDK
jgi:hypothetical protein